LSRPHPAAGSDSESPGLSHPLPPLLTVGDNAAMQAEPPKAAPPKRKRRWFQFSLWVTLLARRNTNRVQYVLQEEWAQRIAVAQH
jgi:hypothetical protein